MYLKIAFLLLSFLISSRVAFAEGIKKNHSYSEVKVGYDKSDLGGCSFKYSPIDFCDAQHVAAINDALKNKAPDFFNHYILILYPERPEYHQHSILAVNVDDGLAYPVPIDSYSGVIKGKGASKDDGVVKFSTSENKICINGSILVYRSFQNGNFCFEFDGSKFVGFHTEYMYP